MGENQQQEVADWPRTPQAIVAVVESRIAEHHRPNHPDTLCLWLKVAELKLRMEGR